MSRRLPLFPGRISAGFPSPAEDFSEPSLDLDELLISHPAATFYVKVSGDSMQHAAICDGDILVVDRAIQAEHNTIIVASLHGTFTVKRLSTRGGSLSLLPANPRYQPTQITAEMDFQIWGVVTYCIHQVK